MSAIHDQLMHHKPALLCAIRRYISSPEDVDDVLQNTMLKALERHHQVRSPELLGGWLRQIAVREALDWYRRRAPRLDPHQIDLPKAEPTPDARLCEVEVRHAVTEAIGHLPAPQRSVAHAFYLDGASYREIEHGEGLTHAAVTGRLYKARGRLRDALRHYRSSVLPLFGQSSTLPAFVQQVLLGLAALLTGVVAFVLLPWFGARAMVTGLKQHRAARTGKARRKGLMLAVGVPVVGLSMVFLAANTLSTAPKWAVLWSLTLMGAIGLSEALLVQRKRQTLAAVCSGLCLCIGFAAFVVVSANDVPFLLTLTVDTAALYLIARGLLRAVVPPSEGTQIEGWRLVSLGAMLLATHTVAVMMIHFMPPGSMYHAYLPIFAGFLLLLESLTGLVGRMVRGRATYPWRHLLLSLVGVGFILLNTVVMPGFGDRF